MDLKKALKNLIKEGKLKKQSSETGYINNLLNAAKRNFDAAGLVEGKISEAAFKLIYDGLLQISRATLLLNGYRPDDGEQHKTTFYVTGLLLGSNYSELIDKIQRFRIKRNNCVYSPSMIITSKETEIIQKTAKEFWIKIKEYLKSKDPQLQLFDL